MKTKTFIRSIALAFSLAIFSLAGSTAMARPINNWVDLEAAATVPQDTPGTFKTAPGQVSVPGVPEVDRLTLMTTVRNTSGPVLIEFYDSTSADTSGECARQIPVFSQVSKAYAGKITFLRFDIAQDMKFAEALRATVCPTHIFVDLTKSEPNKISKRHWGFLSNQQFQELIKEYFDL